MNVSLLCVQYDCRWSRPALWQWQASEHQPGGLVAPQNRFRWTSNEELLHFCSFKAKARWAPLRWFWGTAPSSRRNGPYLIQIYDSSPLKIAVSPIPLILWSIFFIKSERSVKPRLGFLSLASSLNWKPNHSWIYRSCEKTPSVSSYCDWFSDRSN